MARARAIATRWRWPPESSAGKRDPHAGRESHAREKRADALRQRAPAGELLHAERLGDLIARPHARVERGLGILEDDLQLAAAAAELLALELQPVDTAEANLSGVRREQPGHDSPGRGLAAARLADEGEGLAGFDPEVDAPQGGKRAARGPEHAPSNREALLQTLGRKQRLAHPGIARGPLS